MSPSEGTWTPSDTNQNVVWESLSGVDATTDAHRESAVRLASQTRRRTSSGEKKPAVEPSVDVEPKHQRKRRSAWDEDSSQATSAQMASMDVNDISITANYDSLPTRQIRRILKERGICVVGCLERSDLLEKARSCFFSR